MKYSEDELIEKQRRAQMIYERSKYFISVIPAQPAQLVVKETVMSNQAHVDGFIQALREQAEATFGLKPADEEDGGEDQNHDDQ